MKLALGLLLLTLAASIEVSHSKPNTFVLHVDSKFTTESRWLATFTLHVQPYFHHLRELYCHQLIIDHHMLYFILLETLIMMMSVFTHMFHLISIICL